MYRMTFPYLSLNRLRERNAYQAESGHTQNASALVSQSKQLLRLIGRDVTPPNQSAPMKSPCVLNPTHRMPWAAPGGCSVTLRNSHWTVNPRTEGSALSMPIWDFGSVWLWPDLLARGHVTVQRFFSQRILPPEALENRIPKRKNLVIGDPKSS